MIIYNYNLFAWFQSGHLIDFKINKCSVFATLKKDKNGQKKLHLENYYKDLNIDSTSEPLDIVVENDIEKDGTFTIELFMLTGDCDDYVYDKFIRILLNRVAKK